MSVCKTRNINVTQDYPKREVDTLERGMTDEERDILAWWLWSEQELDAMAAYRPPRFIPPDRGTVLFYIVLCGLVLAGVVVLTRWLI